MKFGQYLIGSVTGTPQRPAAPIADPEFLADLGTTRMIYSTHDSDLASAQATLNRFADEVITRFWFFWRDTTCDKPDHFERFRFIFTIILLADTASRPT